MSEARLSRQPGVPRPDIGQLIRSYEPEVSRPFPKIPLVAEKPKKEQGTAVRQPVARSADQRQPQNGDLLSFVQRKVTSGELTPEQGMNILGMGKNEAERQAVLQQIQAQEKQQEEAFKELGITNEAHRLAEIEKELPQTLIPIEGAHHLQEWRERKELKSGKPWERLYGQVTDVFVIDNPDGTQTQYVDRTPRWYHKMRFASLKEGAYEETYGPKGRFGKRKLLERKRIGHHIEQIGWEQPEGEKPKPKYAVATDRHMNLLEEQFMLEREIQEKQKTYFFSKIDMGGTDYIPSKKEKQRAKSVEDTITRILWSVKDTPKEQRVFMARNIATNFAFYSLFQTLMPDLGLIGTPWAGVVGAGYAVGSYYGLFSWKDVGKYIKDHPVATALSAATMGLFFVNPALGLAAYGAQLAWGMRELPKQIRTNMALKKEFKKNNPEITGKKEFSQAFEAYKNEELQRRARVEFAERHGEWLKKLKELNPNVPEDTLMQAMLLRAGEFGQGAQELQAIMQSLVNTFTTASALPRFGVLAFAKPIELGMGLFAGLFGLPPIVGRLAASLSMSMASTGISTYAIEKTMSNLKADIVEKYPHLIPLSERKHQQ